MQSARALCNVHVIATDVKHGQINEAFNTHKKCMRACMYAKLNLQMVNEHEKFVIAKPSI